MSEVAHRTWDESLADAVASYELSDPAIDSQIITDSMSAAKADGRPPTSVPGQDRP